MSTSSSGSGSFSSSEAIIAHFDEAAGTLDENGYPVSAYAWESITRALKDETVAKIAFWGVDGEGEGEALLELVIDWSEHEVRVTGGDSVDMPLKDGEICLIQVRKSAEGFLRGFHEKGLRPEMRVAFTPKAQLRAEELRALYGWSRAPAVRKKTTGAGWEVASRYHAAVRLGVWFSD